MTDASRSHEQAYPPGSRPYDYFEIEYRARRAAKSQQTQRRRQARAIYDYQMRNAIMGALGDGTPEKQIANDLGQTVPTIRRYKALALKDAIERAQNPAFRYSRYDIAQYILRTYPEYQPVEPHPSFRTRPPRPQHRFASAYRPMNRALPPPGSPPPPPDPPGPTTSSSPPPKDPDEVLDPPEVVQLRQQCLYLRKAMVPFDLMAQHLGISTAEARRYTADAINELQRSEQFNADMHRQLMIEQIDQMIAAIHAPATGYDLHGQRVSVVFEAIDKMLKLMKQKAELMGINQPPPMDIRIKLQQLAEEGQYDIVDLEDIARDVLQAHKVRLPEFR